MNLKIYIDGNFHDQAEAKISVLTMVYSTVTGYLKGSGLQ
jgi:hypothetical protein